MPLLLIKAIVYLKAWWPWLRWVLLACAVLFAVLTFTQLADYLGAKLAQRHLSKQTQRVLAGHNARQVEHRRASRTADSLFTAIDGQRRESAARAATLKQVYDAQKAALPTAPAWPALPPRP